MLHFTVYFKNKLRQEVFSNSMKKIMSAYNYIAADLQNRTSSDIQ